MENALNAVISVGTNEKKGMPTVNGIPLQMLLIKGFRVASVCYFNFFTSGSVEVTSLPGPGPS